jgi:hypothetical protein
MTKKHKVKVDARVTINYPEEVNEAEADLISVTLTELGVFLKSIAKKSGDWISIDVSIVPENWELFSEREND